MTAFIWDLDGTLFDSYPIIVSSICQALEESGITVPEEVILRDITATSVSDFFRRIAEEHGRDDAALFSRCCQLQTFQDNKVRLNPHGETVLKSLYDQGAMHFVYTHKGPTAQAVLDRLGIGQYFTEVITAGQGFARKPDPAGVDYLVRRHSLNKERCYYVGDRLIDMECAANAHIHSILYLYSQSSLLAKDLATYCVSDLRQILELNI